MSPETGLLDALSIRVSDSPGDTWLRYAGRAVSWGEADAWSSGLAAALRGCGVRPGDRVAVCVQNTPVWPITALAVWKLGAAVVSVSPLLRAADITKLLADSGARVLVVEDRRADELRGAGVALIVTSPRDLAGDRSSAVLDGVEPVPVAGAQRWLDLAAAEPLSAPYASPAPADLAYLTYTSGTTGPAKGAMNSHGNVAAGGRVYRDVTGLGPTDVIGGFAPLFHVTGITGHIAASLLTGCPLVLAYRFDPGDVLALLESERVTFVVCAVTALTALLHHPDRATTDLSALTKLWSGGQAVPASTATAIEAAFGVPVRNAYGMTETTYPTHLVAAGERAPVDPQTGVLSIGRVSPGTESWIEAEDGTRCRTGEIGEIVVRGPGVVSGYWQQPDETAAAMPGGALHTGDVGYVDPAGWFFLVDRKKDLINTSGYKVWPREVEDVLLGHPAVREAAVVGAPDPYRGEAVAAYVSLVPGCSVTTADLAAFAKARLASYKYPRTVQIVDELPKNASGKILRRALRTARAETPS